MDNLNKLQQQEGDAIDVYQEKLRQLYKPKIDVVEFSKNFQKSYPVAKQALEDFRHQQAEVEVFGRMLPR